MSTTSFVDRVGGRRAAGAPPAVRAAYCPARNSIRRLRARPSAESFGAIG